MLIKFFGGRGGGGGIANYLVDPTRPGREGSAPEIVRGDIEQTVALIDSSDRKWSYTTGVLSFAIEDAPTEAQQIALMDDFERLAFAGLRADQYDITWVRHSHTEGGRTELHFLVPRMELASGKAFNIAPPGWERAYAPLRDAYNFEFGWARPDDPARSRTQHILGEAPERARTREAITTFLEAKILSGEVSDRPSMIMALQGAGLEVPRQGKSYLTALDPHTGERWRLKGRIFEQDWTRDSELDRATSASDRSATQRADDPDEQRAAQSRARLEEIIERRAGWVRARYPAEVDQDRNGGLHTQAHDSFRNGQDPRDAAVDVLDERADRSNRIGADMGRADDLDRSSSGGSEGRGERDRSFSDPSRHSRNRLALWDTALRKIGGLIDREPNSDRTGAFERIREFGGRILEAGAAAGAYVRALLGRDQGAFEPSGPARDAFAASERSLEQAERINIEADRAGQTIEQGMRMVSQTRELERDFERLIQKGIER
ncbi:hypothetical protein EU803_08215 [Loktanella sp. IMCC34160]|uniref:relaxase/mobilization nuclease domain-containing protein n=1 Tax=Loktanella sp. IMCC34160 TaxID=2510646 RepID=UPI00101BCEFF|nr:relaxase/mobilization nuclease domain-containing protein [Loktanella sp. IMCC34160]RYG91077.1 hypothetical protein EU803_08215 [Loktanella sp. IMCC34160]